MLAPNKIVADIPDMPRAGAVNHRADTCRRLDCGGIATPETGPVRGAPLGPNLPKTAAGQQGMDGSCRGMAGPFPGLFGMSGRAKPAIRHARDGAADRMGPEAGTTAAEMISGDDPAGTGETPIRRDGAGAAGPGQGRHPGQGGRQPGREPSCTGTFRHPTVRWPPTATDPTRGPSAPPGAAGRTSCASRTGTPAPSKRGRASRRRTAATPRRGTPACSWSATRPRGPET